MASERAITPDNTRSAQECVAHFECMCVCVCVLMRRLARYSRRSLETSGAAGKILRHSKKGFLLEGGGQGDERSLEYSSQTVALFGVSTELFLSLRKSDG